MHVINLKKVLVIGLLSILIAACSQKQLVKPTKPTLQISKQVDGGICLDRQNTKELGEYILNLEQGYK
jgi:hypothetical protein